MTGTSIRSQLRYGGWVASLLLVGCATTTNLTSNANQRPEANQASAPGSASPIAPPASGDTGGLRDNWRRATEEEESETWRYVLHSRLGIAALNQLAIEEFISPVCEKTWYVNEPYNGFQTLLRVQCPDERGASIARGYDEMRVIFNRYEDNIESFEVERVYPDQPPTTNLGS